MKAGPHIRSQYEQELWRARYFEEHAERLRKQAEDFTRSAIECREAAARWAEGTDLAVSEQGAPGNV